MKLLYGTWNQVKLHLMQQWPDGMDIDIRNYLRAIH